MSARPGRSIAALAYAIVGVLSLSTLGIVEWVLRATYPHHVDPTYDHEFLRPHPQLGYVLAPNVVATYRRSDANGGDLIEWSSNADGYRGPELRQPRPLRVVVYGDSNVQAVFSRLENTFPSVLEAHLASALATPVEVVNAGTLGHGPDQYLLRFVSEFERLRPNAVVFNVFADNDLGDPVRHRLLESNAGTLSLRADRFVYPTLTWHQRLQRFASSLVIVKAAARLVPSGDAPPQTALVPDTDPITTYLQRLRELSEVADRQYDARSTEYTRIDHYDLDVATAPDAPSARRKVELLRAILREAVARAREFEVPLVVSIEPSRVDLVRGPPLDYVDLARFPRYRPSNLTATIVAVCREAEATCVDLFGPFAARNPAELYFRADDNHWNDEGQRVAAAAVAPVLIDLLRKRVPTRPPDHAGAVADASGASER